MTILISEKRFLAFLFHYSCFCPVMLSAVMLGQKTLKTRRSKQTFSLSGWLTAQKMLISQGKTFSQWNFQVKALKFLQKKKSSFLSLRHVGMSLASGKLLWFPTDVHQRSAQTKPLYPNADTKNWKTSPRLFLLPSVWGADNPQAPQTSWGSAVSCGWKTTAHLTPSCISCLLYI